jgi:hypothetical protein
MITKTFNYDSALTLSWKTVSEKRVTSGTHTRTHDSGWTITGEICEDYYVWIARFEAVHPKFGKVWGDFEHEVHADGEEGFDDFYRNHTPYEWDYGDI